MVKKHSDRKHNDEIVPIKLDRTTIRAAGYKATAMNGYHIDDVTKVVLGMDSVIGLQLKNRCLDKLVHSLNHFSNIIYMITIHSSSFISSGSQYPATLRFSFLVKKHSDRKHNDEIVPIKLDRTTIRAAGYKATAMNGYHIDDVTKVVLGMDSVIGLQLKNRCLDKLVHSLNHKLQ